MAKIFRTIFIVTIFLAFLGGTANALAYKDVRLTDNGKTENFKTSTSTVGKFLEEKKIVLNENDLINVSLDTKILENYTTEIEIARGIDVKVYIDDKPEIYNVPAGTRAGDIISKLEKEYNVSYILDVKRTEVLSNGQSIYLKTSSTHTFTVVEFVPYKVIVQEDNTLSVGEIKIVQEGQYGEKTVVTKVELVQGVQTKETVISEKKTKDPVDQIVKKGTMEATVNQITTEKGSLLYSKQYTMEATAYTAGPESTGKRPGDPGYGITASGMKAKKGVVAVDTKVIPLGTELYIEGYGYAIAADTGSGIRGFEIDLFFENLDDAISFGRRDVVVYVLS